jgi:hypothetical protein
MNAEYYTLEPLDKARVDAVIEDAKRVGKMTNTHYGKVEYYAYPHASGGTAWGINGGKHGFNVKRGVMPR